MVQVIKKALIILKYISLSPNEPKGLGEIAKATGLNASTCARILSTLIDGMYVEQIASRKGYILGHSAYALGAKGSYRQDLILASESNLKLLMEEIDETSLLAILSGNHRVIVLQKNSSREIYARSRFSVADNPYLTATGRLLLAYLDTSAIRTFIDTYGLPDKEIWSGVQSVKSLHYALEQIRYNGMAIRESNDVIGLGFPVTVFGEIRCALGCYMPAFRFKGEHKEKVVAALKRHSIEIGYNIEKGEKL